MRDLTGHQFFNLKVLKVSGKTRQGSITWLCECICGKLISFSSDHLTRKKSPVKSCGCQIRRGKTHQQWQGYEEISGNWWYRVTRERTQTSRAKVPVTITMEYAWRLFIKQNRRCALSGIELIISNTAKYNTASIDRIDNSKGYEPDNIQWVHKHINFMKRNHSQEYFIEMCKLVADNSQDNAK